MKKRASARAVPATVNKRAVQQNQPLRLTNPAADALPHAYILCTDKGPGDILAPLAAHLTMALEILEQFPNTAATRGRR